MRRLSEMSYDHNPFDSSYANPEFTKLDEFLRFLRHQRIPPVLLNSFFFRIVQF